MTAKPETAAEVLADINKLIAQNPLHDVSIGGFKTYLGHLIDFRDRIERALSAQGEAAEYQFRYSCGNWSRCTRDEYESKAIDSTSPVTGVEFRALYTHPAPTRVTVTDAMHVAAARAIWSLRRDEEDRCDQELEDLPPNHSVWDEARAALTAALEDGRHG